MTALHESAVSTEVPAQFDAGLHQIELRHLRYFVAVAEVGTFTGAADQVFVAQPTLSQQVRRLEEMVGTPLLTRRRDGVHLTDAGRVLFDEARLLLSRVESGLRRTRHMAGVGRPRLRLAVPPQFPEDLVLQATTALVELAKPADVEVTWNEMAIEADFSAVAAGHADAALGWWPSPDGHLSDSLDVMTISDFQPEVWVSTRSRWPKEDDFVSVEELAGMDVFHGPRDQAPAVYDAWRAVLRSHRAEFTFKDPPFRCRWAATLATAPASERPRAVLTSPDRPVGHCLGLRVATSAAIPAPGIVSLPSIDHRLSATAVMVWSVGLSRDLQQLVFDVADLLATSYGPHISRRSASHR
jgi:DNA-binding transcriptional LysR family regulator